MTPEQIAKKFEQYFGLSEDAALFAGICAIGGFTVDAWFFPAGIPPGTVTVLSGGGGYVAYRWLKKTPMVSGQIAAQIGSTYRRRASNKRRGGKHKNPPAQRLGG